VTVSTVIFRSSVIAICDLAVVTAGAWVLWNSSETSVVSGPLEDKMLFVLVTALLLTVRHTVSRSTNPLLVRSRTAWTVLVVELLLAAAGVTAWQLTGIYYVGWITTFALMFFIIGTGFELLVDIVTSRYRSSGRASFATELTRLAVVIGAAAGFTLMAPVHAWDIAFIHPLLLMICSAIGLSVVPAALAFTGVLTGSSLARDLNFAVAERHDSDSPVEAERPKEKKGKVRPGPVRTENAPAPDAAAATVSTPDLRERARSRTSDTA
jgi:hypothetical protein